MPELSGWLRIYDSHHTSVMLDLHMGVNMDLVPSGNNDAPHIVSNHGYFVDQR